MTVKILSILFLLSVWGGWASAEWVPGAAALSSQSQDLLSPKPIGCIASSDCAIGESCINGKCVYGSCTGDSQCAIGEHCVAGKCTR
jgi:Cys-rich repeat protein